MGFILTDILFGLRIPAFPIDGSSSKNFVTQIIRFIDELKGDFSSAWVCDHFIPWANFVSKDTPNLEGFTTVAYLSGLFQDLMFGHIVLCNSYRNPALLAKMASTLQVLSNGRYILGIGAGWKMDEYIAYGYKFPPAKVRIKQLEEAVQIIRKMWTEDRVTFHGKYYHIEDAVCSPKPDPIPPIMIGGGGEKYTLRVVAKYADWWNIPNVSPNTYIHKLRVLEKHCKDVGRNFRDIVKTLANIVAIAESENKARRMAYENPFIDMNREENYIIGSPEKVLEKISRYIEIGVKIFILRFIDFPKTDGAKLFVKKVVSKLI